MSIDSQKLRFRLIEWLAESPNRKVKAERKQSIATTLDVSPRQVERLLNQYHEDRLHEATGIERSDKGNHRIHEYWQNYIRKVYENSLKDKHPLKLADVVREVQRHVVICGAGYAEVPYHRIGWQAKSTKVAIGCDRHQLRLLSKCPQCKRPFPIPSLWAEEKCTNCSLLQKWQGFNDRFDNKKFLVRNAVHSP